MVRPRAATLLTALLAAAALAAGCGGDDKKNGSSGTPEDSNSVFGGSKDCKDADDTLKKVARDHILPLKVQSGGGEGTVDRVTLEVCRTTDENATATVTVYGMRDKAIRDTRHDIRLIQSGGLWQVADDQHQTRCQPGHGPQEFSTTFCQ